MRPLFGAMGSHKWSLLYQQWSSLGTLRNWWSNSTSEQYEQRAKCIIDQYGNYTADQVGVNLNGINNQGENIADNGGIKEAYGGYRKSLFIDT